MMADFDIAAQCYDQDFTHSAIGRLQRKRVWRLLDRAIGDKQKLKVLELNCGTGEDARILASKGHKVVATDISEEMLAVARSKNMDVDISFHRLDLNDMDAATLDSDFDLIFSNFGGLNCVDTRAIERLSQELSQIIKPGGKFIAVIMPAHCVWENLYLLLKGRFSQIGRRARDVVEVNVSGQMVKTWYFNPGFMSQILGDHFAKKTQKPIGLFLPPSYMERFFHKKKGLLRMLNGLESLFANFSWQARFADHYYIEFIKT